MPERIQRQRVKGYRLPEGAVYVGRPSAWGNPIQAGEPYRFIDAHGITVIGVATANRSGLVSMFRRYLEARPDLHDLIRKELGGKDLACWCPLVDADGDPVPCHANVLLEYAALRGDES